MQSKVWLIYKDDIYEQGEYAQKQFSKYFDCTLFKLSDFKFLNKVLYYQNIKIDVLPKVIYNRAGINEIIKYFAQNNVFCIEDPETVIKSTDKLYCYNVAKRLGLLIPKTFKLLSYKQCVQKLGETFVLKDNFGKKGENVYLIKTEKEYCNAVNMFSNKQHIICQQFIDGCQSSDYRVVVFKEKVLMVLKRTSKDEFRSNISVGGSAQITDVPELIKHQSEKIAHAIKLKFGSVDFLFNGEKYYFCESNSSIGLRSIIKQDIDIFALLAKYIQQQL